jgi:amidase
MVARLRGAGAVILGKTNLPVGAADWQSYNSVYGQTNNPWDLGVSPGGSSGGSAAALAAGLTPLEFGGDIGGSVRIPAGFCGVFGHKPTYGLIPKPGPSPPTDISVRGPLARCAADLKLLLTLTAGPVGGASGSPHGGTGGKSSPLPSPAAGGAGAYKLALRPPRHRSLSSYRVGLLSTDPLCPTSRETRHAVARVGARSPPALF